MTHAALECRELAVRFGGVDALAGCTFSVRTGEICGLIGPNGAGKSTALDVISGLTRADRGQVLIDGRDVTWLRGAARARLGLARTFQHLQPPSPTSVVEHVMVGAHRLGRAGFVRSSVPFAATGETRRARRDALALLERLGLAGVARRRVSDLPFGSRKRVELARALAGRPQVLLLDEPANGLARGETEELGEVITGLRGDLGLTIVVIEHHMGLVMSVSDSVVVLDDGRVIAAGAPAQVRADPAVVAAYLGVAAG